MVMAMGQLREDWQRLASYVISARTSAGFTNRQEFSAATGISARTLGKLETGQRVSPETLAAVALALKWSPNSPARVLAGREPVPAGAAEPPPRPDIMHAPSGPEEEFIAAILPLLRAEDQEVVRGIRQLVDGEGRPWPWERQRALIESYVAQHARRQPEAG